MRYVAEGGLYCSAVRVELALLQLCLTCGSFRKGLRQAFSRVAHCTRSLHVRSLKRCWRRDRRAVQLWRPAPAVMLKAVDSAAAESQRPA